MRKTIVPLVASVALLAMPAFAQTGRAATDQSSATAGSASGAAGQTLTSETKHRIRQSLDQSGFKNVQVLPEAFVIHAVAPDGSRVMMQMSPDQFAELVVPNGQSSSNAGGTNGASASNTHTGNQTGTSSTGASGTLQSGSTSSPANGASSLAGGSSSAAKGPGGANLAQQIRQSLQKNGFKDIRIMPEAFLIRGQAPNGSRMVMVVSPDEAEGIVAPGSGSGSSASHNGLNGRSATPNSQNRR